MKKIVEANSKGDKKGNDSFFYETGDPVDFFN